jgi:hypothetical protein
MGHFLGHHEFNRKTKNTIVVNVIGEMIVGEMPL